mmetsp:Transcript_23476/g.65168  ORF Transcript_23476/g.65168 Transcript_23476/m.65168 type:complete len:498 (-) Transcript_23476:1400-2893(-)
MRSHCGSLRLVPVRWKGTLQRMFCLFPETRNRASSNRASTGDGYCCGVDTRIRLPGASKVATTAATSSVAATIATTSSVATTTTTVVVVAVSTTVSAAVVALTEIASSKVVAATTAATATSTTPAVGSHLVQPLRNFLLVLVEHVTEFADDSRVLLVHERKRVTGVTRTSGTTDSVHVVVNVGGQIEIDHLGNIGDVQPTTGNIGCGHHRSVSTLEAAKGIFSFALRLVPMNGAGRETVIAQTVLEIIAVALGFREDQDQPIFDRQEVFHQCTELVLFLYVLNLLGDILGSGTDATNGQEDVIAEEITGQALDLCREGRTEHHGLAIFTLRHSGLLYNATDLGFETHIKHAIGFVQHQELDVFHSEATTFDQIDQSPRGCHQQITTALDIAELVSHLGTTVDAYGSDTGAVRETARFVVDLLGEFAGGSHDQGFRVHLTATVGGRLTSSGAKHGHDDGKEEPGGLSTTRLSTGHQIAAGTSNRAGVLLDRGGPGVPT